MKKEKANIAKGIIMPKISVIVPIYDVEEFLPRCLDYLIGQTLKDIEIILIDDGSPDNCGKFCDKYATRDKRIKVIHQKNSGVAVARNAGLNIAKGKYIAFCDPDDYIDTDFLGNLYSAAIKSGADIVKGKFVINSENGQTDQGPAYSDIRKNRAWFQYAFMSAIYKHSFLSKNKIDFPVGIITSQDVVFLTKAVLLANQIELVENSSYYNYNRREGSLDSFYLSDKKVKSKIDSKNLIIDFINNLDNLDDETYNIIFSKWLNYLIDGVFFRNDSIMAKMSVIDAIFDLYGKCKYKYLYNKNNPIYGNFLQSGNRIHFFDYLQGYNLKIPTCRYYLFGFIPFLKVTGRIKKKSYRLFNFIPLITFRVKGFTKTCRLFDLLPLFTKRF